MARKKKKNEKKPRTLSIGIGIESGSELVFGWSQDAQTLAYQVKKEGKTVKPVNHIVGYSYDRPDNPPKFIIASSSTLLPPLPDFNELLTRFTYIVAVDTSYQYLGKDQVCATCIIIIKIKEEPEGWIPIFQSSYGLEFWNPVNHAERFGWKKAIELIQGFKSYTDEQRFLLIVDPFMRDIPKYNLRKLPLLDDYYLPTNFEMLYASSDAGSPFIANRLFSDADKESKELWKQIAKHRPNEKELKISTTDGCTYFKLWIPTIYVEEIESNAKQGQS